MIMFCFLNFQYSGIRKIFGAETEQFYDPLRSTKCSFTSSGSINGLYHLPRGTATTLRQRINRGCPDLVARFSQDCPDLIGSICPDLISKISHDCHDLVAEFFFRGRRRNLFRNASSLLQIALRSREYWHGIAFFWSAFDPLLRYWSLQYLPALGVVSTA